MKLRDMTRWYERGQGKARLRVMVYGLWFMGYGLWFMVYGLWVMGYGV